MLRELRITNFAIIDELALEFAPGMNVLTGETGAGKTIIMRAIELLCGGRAATDLIRSDADEAEIEGLFDLRDPRLLQDYGLDSAGQLLIRRVISNTGKGRIYVNGSLATGAMLSQLGNRLIHVYGQHEHALLLKPDSHLDLLDEFGKLAPQREQMAQAHDTLRAAAARLAALTAGNEAARQRVELLRFQVKELRDALLQRGEEEQLQLEREVLRHAAQLSQVCQESEDALYAGDNAITAALARVASQLQEAGRVDPAFGEHAEMLRQAATQVEEVAAALRRAAERIREDPERLEHIEDRLALLRRLTRKYDCSEDELVERGSALEEELAGLEEAGTDAAALRQEVLARAADAWSVARELSHARQAVAAKLEKRMVDELRTLGMRGGMFRVVFTVSGSDAPQTARTDTGNSGAAGLSATGADLVEFYLSANPGENPKALARIASGGELSRIMLALKALTAAAGEVPTLIFDEVDAGIGGMVAEAVGKRLRTLGRSRQVLCITHLPQIAAQADHHFAVEKHVARGRTTASARALDNDERVGELTRMLGGAATAESSRYARRLIEGAAKSEPR